MVIINTLMVRMVMKNPRIVKMVSEKNDHET